MCAHSEPQLPIDDETARILGHVLEDFAPSEDPRGKWGQKPGSRRVERSEMPLPQLAYLLLTQVLSCPDLGIGEKVAWQVAFRYQGRECLLSQRKMGLFLTIEGGDEGLLNEVVSRLQKAVTVLEKRVLRGLIDTRRVEGDLLVANQCIPLRALYAYFREQAQQAFGAARAPDTEEMGAPGTGELFIGLSRKFERQELGAFNALAAITGYFSWLEHVLVMALAFSPLEPGDGALVGLIEDGWGNKFRALFGEDREAQRVRNLLWEVAETYRNTFAHGGHEKAGSALGIRVPGVGYVPTSLSGVRDSPHFALYPLDEESFKDVCDALDEVDAFLRTGPSKAGVRYAESGLDVVFDAQTRKEYREAAGREEDLEALIERNNELIDRAMNMDW
jgi:hypothetical protein